MNDTVGRITEIVKEKCEQHKRNAKFGYYDYWNDHIKRVLYHSEILSAKQGADAEIVRLAALLHDVSMPSEYGDRSEHHSYSADMTEELLTELGFPRDRLELVKRCVFNHPNRNAHLRSTLEETIISYADALAHFDRIPSLFSLAYGILNMKLDDGREYVKERLQGDYNGLSDYSKREYKEKIETLMEALFVK